MTDGDGRALSQAERTAWRSYVRGAALLRETLNRSMEAQAGLSLGEYEVLDRLADAPDGALRMAALADDVVNSRSRLTHTVARMEARGLVERRACAADGRGVFCALTAAGAAAFAAAQPHHLAAVRACVVDLLTPEELETVGGAMARIAERLDGDGAPALVVERAV